jgi:hypothetical protein
VELAAVAKLQGITLKWFTESGRAALVVLGNHPIKSWDPMEMKNVYL